MREGKKVKGRKESKGRRKENWKIRGKNKKKE